jgi:CRP-like cAMP-binding protein
MEDYRVEVLRDVPGLTFVADADLADLAQCFDVTEVTDEIICEEGGTSEHIYVLAEGQAEVIKLSGAGRRFKVATLMPGVMFGHVGVLMVQPRTATVRSVGTVRLLKMPAKRAREILRTAKFKVASPFRRALIVALSRQVFSATATTMNLAVAAGVTVHAVQGPVRPVRLPSQDPQEADEALQAARAQQL